MSKYLVLLLGVVFGQEEFEFDTTEIEANLSGITSDSAVCNRDCLQ